MDDYRPISQKELERGYFLVTHRLIIKKIALISAIVILIIFYAIIIWQFFNYLRSQSFNQVATSIDQSKIDWAAYHNSRAPQNLDLDKPTFISLGDRKYNIVALVANPNQNWAVKNLDYHFVSQGEATPTQTAFINPGETRLLAITGYDSDKAIRDPELVISDIEWYRIDSRFPQINIEVSGIAFQAASRQTVDGVTTQLPARVSWQAYNDSVYNFWEINWQVALYNGDKLVALNEPKTKDFLALERRDMETVWLGGLPRVTRAEVFPLINKLDSGIFKDIYVVPNSDRR